MGNHVRRLPADPPWAIDFAACSPQPANDVARIVEPGATSLSSATMARTVFFAQLRKIYRDATGTTSPPATERAPLALRLERRALLQGSIAAFVAAQTACKSSSTPSPSREKVAVIGGGIAGLHCALRLKEAGIDVTVFEAQKRVGGRMFTGRALFSQAPDQICELGGELIDTNHATLFALATELGIPLVDRFEGEPAGFKREQYFLGGVEVADATLTTQFAAVAPLMASLEQQADEDEAEYAKLDATTLDDWLRDNVPVATYPELHAALKTAYRGEFGLETSEQSCLNLLYLIGSEAPDPFRIFGESDERYHAAPGNDVFPQKIAEALGAEAIRLEHTLTAIAESDAGYTLTLGSPAGPTTFEATRVVFAIPFTVLREIPTALALFSEEKRDVVENLGYGTNAKVMAGFASQVWRTTHAASGSLTTDLPAQQTWDTTIGQTGPHGILTNFVGGAQGLASGSGTEDAWIRGVLPDLERVWPGVTAAYTGTAVRMHWPTVPSIKASYTCYKPGQWAYFGTEGTREGNLHFCGEHTSQDFQGWMEGGAETGALVAKEIIDEAGGKASEGLHRSLGVKPLFPQSTYKADRFGKLGLMQRRRVVREIRSDLARSLSTPSDLADGADGVRVSATIRRADYR